MYIGEVFEEIRGTYPEVNDRLINNMVLERLASEVNEREEYIKRLHRLIEVSVDLGWHTELVELMNEVPNTRSYET